MSSNFTGNPNNFLPTDYILPDDHAQFLVVLRQYLNSIASAVNTKDSGIYDSTILVTGQQFYPLFSTQSATSANYRGVFRIVVDTGTLPTSSTKSVAHGIATQSTYSFVKIYGCATDPGASTIDAAIPLPYINTTTPGDSVTLNIDATNINLTTTTANYATYTRSFVVLEYITVI